jgi:hypothetical protein
LRPHENSSVNSSFIDPYGSTESTRVDGEGVSALLTWDSKVLTVVSILGGVTDLVREKMKQDGIYDEFIEIAEVREPPANKTNTRALLIIF